MEKAFDKVAHERLLYKLEYLGIRNALLHWICSYSHRQTALRVPRRYLRLEICIFRRPTRLHNRSYFILIYINDIGSELSPDTFYEVIWTETYCNKTYQAYNQWNETCGMKFNTK